tara:strand:- start:892 stop:1497 length:606 start_codon:yes stop_codon:yes gene_type:complete
MSESKRAGNDSDYLQVAKIHASCIKDGFLTSLGERFLKLLYEAIDTNENSILILEKSNDDLVGFVAGGRSMKPIYIKLLLSFPKLFFALIPAVFNPMNIKRIIELIFFGSKQHTVASNPSAELFSIAVVDKARGTGVASKLYQSLGERFAQEGEKAFCIIVGETLVPAHRFYQKMGAFALSEVSVHKGQSSTLYRQNLPIP